MIETVEIKNFKSIQNAQIKFSPLTVLVGTNGAGKSNLMLALAFLSHLSNHGLAAAVNYFGGFRNLLPQMALESKQEQKITFSVSMSLPSSQAKQVNSPLTIKYELEFGHTDLAATTEDVRITHEKMSFDQFLPPAESLLADLTTPADTFRTRVSAIRRYELPPSSKPIEPSHNGGQTSTLFALSSIRQPEKEASWNRILRTLATIAPHVEFGPPYSQKTESIVSEGPNRAGSLKRDSWEFSGGMARALGILFALETHPEDGTLLIEEPEQSLHPWAIRTLMEHIREVTSERGIQVILTTHSPMVLERVYPNEVLIVERSEQEGTTFQTIKEILPYSDIARGEVGELWVHGLLGGVPSYE